MMEPDFPMTPPTREAWQRRRNTTRLGSGELLLAAAGTVVAEWGTEEAATRLGSCISEVAVGIFFVDREKSRALCLSCSVSLF